jgi:hypothetical protein
VFRAPEGATARSAITVIARIRKHSIFFIEGGCTPPQKSYVGDHCDGKEEPRRCPTPGPGPVVRQEVVQLFRLSL